MPGNIGAPRGTKDVLPAEAYKWHYIEKTAREVAGSFGFRETRFPTFEHTELFLRGVGGTTDVVQKEMYTFEDKGGRSISLRPEGTASVVRSFIEHSLFAGGLPVKAYYIAPNFRYEKPQAGRLREHHQFGVEIFGPKGPESDAEVIALGEAYLRKLGIRNLRLELNSIGCPECRPAFHAALKAYFNGHKDSLCSTCLDRLERNPLRILDCKSEVCGEIARNAPVGLDFLCGECREHFEGVRGQLEAMGIGYTVNPRIVRGLDYYTRTVFEFVAELAGAPATLCGGGRYDGLVETLGGPATPALGFGSGIERAMLVLEAEGGAIPEAEPCRIFLASQGEEAGMAVTRLVHELRLKGIYAERDLMSRSMKAQMKYADKLGAGFSAAVGDDELKSGVVTIRDMAAGGRRECRLDAEALYDAIGEKR